MHSVAQQRNCSMSRAMAILAAVVAMWGAARPATAAEPTINFNRQIRPILSDKCFTCHGPDAEQLQAGLRLDLSEIAHRELDSGMTAIVAGDPDASELVRRIESDDEAERMPPVDSQKSLTADEKKLLRLWIAEGGEYTPHWSFVPPRKPPAPDLPNDTWSRNDIDRFVLKRLRDEGLTPSPEADRRTLIRRVSFDLTGLPPTIAEVDAFLADDQPGAFERVVDRLLASPRYGERMAIHWLDLARYADSDGYEKDGHRDMWPFRDWVIRAFNSNKRFDEFTIEQLAGDMLPNATRDEKIASAFNRNNPTTSEAGSDPEEYAAKYAIDRATTTSVVWFGLTMQCAECHDHKFDPVTTEDFYRLFAFFNQIPEIPLYDGTDCPPTMAVPSSKQEARRGQLDSQIAEAKADLEATASNFLNADSEGECRSSLLAEFLFDEDDLRGCINTAAATNHGVLQPLAAASTNQEAGAKKSVGIAGKGWRFDGDGVLEFAGVLPLDFERGFSYGAWVKPTPQGGVVISKTDCAQGNRGFDLYLQGGKALVHLIDTWPGAVLKVTSAGNYVPNQWLHVMVVWDGRDAADSIQLYFNGLAQPVTVEIDARPLRSLANDAPLRIGSRPAGESAFHGEIDEVRVFNRPLSGQEVVTVVGSTIRGLLALGPAHRDGEQSRVTAAFCRDSLLVPATENQRNELTSLEKQSAALQKQIPKLRIMQQVAEPKPTYILVRGDYRNHGKQVTSAIPAVLGKLPVASESDRLALARWVVGRENPLTARVTINRFWAICFGNGLVNTPNDFGSQGEWPSHPQLLDWLASEFIDNGWDVKAMLRLIVTSSTYQQSSVATPALVERDPQNRLLARGPRQRLPAEMVRDNVLAVSGLLHEQLGGPSVYPYHPAGLWEEMSWADSPWKTWPQSTGDDLHRRGLYTFWKRSVLHPALAIFDAPTRNVCEVARSTTNTPLQAFATLNETSFVESARALAERMMTEADGTEPNLVDHVYLLVLSRHPSAKEQQVLVDLYQDMQRRFSEHPEDAAALLKVGELPNPQQLDPAKLAAWTTVAQVILNLDESLTKE